MRQTTRAVALLLTLESASAATANRVAQANIPVPTIGDPLSETAFNPSSASLVTASAQLNSRVAPFAFKNPNAIFTVQETGPKWLAAVGQKATIGGSPIAVGSTVLVPGSSCMACIGGSGVWCSRTYSYLSTSTFQYAATTYAAGRMDNAAAQNSDAKLLGGAALDQGSCCETAANFSTFIGTLSVPAATYTVPANSGATLSLTMLQQACPATAGNTVSTDKWAVASLKIEATTTAWTSWWCSNGLYKKVTVGGSTAILNAQQIIPQGTNKRQELAQIGCPQLKAACGVSSAIATELTTLAPTFDVAMPLSGFTANQKCTWVAWSTVSAPTFTMMDSALTGTFGLAAAAYQIHNMEYTTASAWSTSQQSLVETSTSDSTGQQQLAPGLSQTSMLPLFWMPALQFSSLRTWYGQGAAAKDDVTGQSQNWMSPGQAPIVNTSTVSLQLAPIVSQLYGNVANVPVSGNVVSTTTTALGATQNYGKYNSIYFDLRQMRYFPAKVAQTVHASGTALALQYTTALGAYNTAKTTWDAYVAILEKNAKQDAFAALFSPPKAPTVPPLPNQPWVPAAYNGYVRATAAEVAAYSASPATPTLVASPTAQQFWTSLSAAQTSGGWGSFTATVFTYRNGWGKSFGTIGYSGDADRLSMSDVWNYKWTCSAASAAGAVPSTTTQCANTYTAVAGQAAGAGTQTAANAVKMVTVVSLWASSNSNSANDASPTKLAWATNGLKLTFTGSAWKSGIVGLTPIAASTAPVAAKSLKGIAGAQALAATSAAALAVAAALY